MVDKGQWLGRWDGRNVACIASGPSLTAEDCELIHAAGLPAIVTNTSFRLAPWADALMAMDAAWWNANVKEVEAMFAGARLTTAQHVTRFGAESLHGQIWFRNFFNSGANAASLAIACGAARVLMIGYDVQKTAGRAHWHPDHSAPMSNGRSMKLWPSKFASVAAYAKRRNCRVINASRETSLTCFERMTLEAALAETVEDVPC